MKHAIEKRLDMRQQGFTLIELLVTVVIAMVVLGGLLLTFVQQNSEYNYQNKRVDAYQDMEFGINFMLSDVRNSLYSQADVLAVVPAVNITIANGSGATPVTDGVFFTVWDAANAAHNHRFRHCYLYRNNQIYFRRDHGASACDGTTPLVGFDPILEGVTFFRVFADTPDTLPSLGALGTVKPSGVPPGLPFMKGRDSTNTVVTGIPGYTILIEIAVDAGYKNGSFLDVKGVDVRATADKRKRIWRYVQGYPGTVVK